MPVPVCSFLKENDSINGVVDSSMLTSFSASSNMYSFLVLFLFFSSQSSFYFVLTSLLFSYQFNFFGFMLNSYLTDLLSSSFGFNYMSTIDFLFFSCVLGRF